MNTQNGSSRSFRHRINRAIGKLRRKLGAPSPISFASALERVLPLVGNIGGVIDVGASDGRWSKQVRRHLPGARYLLIEANAFHHSALAEYAAAESRNDAKLDYVLAAAGDRYGEINFDAADPWGGVASDLSLDEYGRRNLQSSTAIDEQSYIRVPVVTVDGETERRELPGPYFLKLDVHGYELPILQGAAQTLAQAALVQIEVYNFRLTTDSLRMHEMIAHMEQQGFRVLDLCDPIHRADNAFWQIDLFFAPAAHPVFNSNSFM